MTRIRDLARSQAANLGVEIIDVRLKQTNLPSQNLQATFERMRAERVREATDERARGGEAAQRVTAQADRTVIEITSEAQKQAEIIRGEADARRSAVYAEAYSQDPDFFAFYRSLAAYAKSLKEGNTSLVISPDGEFFEYLKSASPEVAAPETGARGAATPAPGQ
jgi:membrane protease subunit HflC